MKMLKHLFLVYSVPVVIVFAVFQLMMSSEKVSEFEIFLISVLPYVTCSYFFVLVTNSPYHWLRNFHSRNQNEIDSFFSKLSKVTLVLFPVLYFFAIPSFLQNGYQRVETNRMTHLDSTHYYKKIDEISPKNQKSKLKCVDKEKDGKKVSTCYEVH